MTAPQGRKKRGEAAVALRMAGASYADIANTLGYKNESTVATVVERSLAAGLTDEQRDQARELAGRRIERLLRAVWGKAMNEGHPEHIAAVRTARELIDRHTRLYGLDAPAEVVVHTPTTDQIEQWVTTVLAHAVPEVEEADVIDVEVGDDPEAASGTTAG